MSDPPRLYGLKAVVLQAADGVGEAVARTFVKHGADVIAVDEANTGIEQRFNSVKGVTGAVADLRQAGGQTALIEKAIGALGGLDIIVCDFPMRPDVPIRAPGDVLDSLLDRRADLTMTLCRAALPHLKKSPAGRIISIGFLRSLFAVDGGDAADRAEQHLAEITKALAAECGEFGITANYVQPGAIMTPTARDAFQKDKALREYCIGSSAAKRIGEPIDVAKVVLFLATDDAVFVSGTGIAVDGGRVDP